MPTAVTDTGESVVLGEDCHSGTPSPHGRAKGGVEAEGAYFDTTSPVVGERVGAVLEDNAGAVPERLLSGAELPVPSPAAQAVAPEEVVVAGHSAIDHVDAGADDSEAYDGRVVGSWQEAEALAAWHMTKLGFGGARLTTAGADGGIDVLADSAVAQVKHQSTAVGSPAVQQLRGAAHAKDWALFYALSGFTRSAVDYANTANVALFHYTTTGHISAVNDAARYVHDQADAVGGFDVTEFELQQAKRELAQEVFDKAVDLFSSSANRAVALAAADPAASALSDSVSVELRRVEAAIRLAGSDSLPPSEFADVVQRILDAAERLNDEIDQYDR